MRSGSGPSRRLDRTPVPESVARRRIDWGVLGVEAFAIFVSVLLGFGVAEWRDTRAEGARRAALLDAFAQEIEANRDDLMQRGTYHHWLGRQIEAGVQAGEIEVLADVFRIENVSGFNPLNLRGTAWQTATATGDLALLDFDTASHLWQLYDAQRQIDAEQERLRAIALDDIASTDPAPVSRMQVLIREFTSLERELMYLCNSALARIARDRGVPPPPEARAEAFERDPFGASE